MKNNCCHRSAGIDRTTIKNYYLFIISIYLEMSGNVPFMRHMTGPASAPAAERSSAQARALALAVEQHLSKALHTVINCLIFFEKIFNVWFSSQDLGNFWIISARIARPTHDLPRSCSIFLPDLHRITWLTAPWRQSCGTARDMIWSADSGRPYRRPYRVRPVVIYASELWIVSNSYL